MLVTWRYRERRSLVQSFDPRAWIIFYACFMASTLLTWIRMVVQNSTCLLSPVTGRVLLSFSMRVTIMIFRLTVYVGFCVP